MTEAASANAGTVHHLRLSDQYLDAVSERAHAARPGRAVLGLIGAVFFTIGFVTAKVLAGFFYCFAWTWAAFAVGWRQARGEPANAPTVEQLMRENTELRLALKRIEPTLS